MFDRYIGIERILDELNVGDRVSIRVMWGGDGCHHYRQGLVISPKVVKREGKFDTCFGISLRVDKEKYSERHDWHDVKPRVASYSYHTIQELEFVERAKRIVLYEK